MPIPRPTTVNTRRCEPSSSMGSRRLTWLTNTAIPTAACGNWSISSGPRSVRIPLPLFQQPKVGRPSHFDADSPPQPSTPFVADVRTRSFQEMTTPLETRVAGLFVFWPLLAQLGFGDLVRQASYPGSRTVPATSALLSLLALKLVDRERRSHISGFDSD